MLYKQNLIIKVYKILFFKFQEQQYQQIVIKNTQIQTLFTCPKCAEAPLGHDGIAAS